MKHYKLLTMLVVTTILFGCGRDRFELKQTIDDNGSYVVLDKTVVEENKLSLAKYKEKLKEYNENIDMGYESSSLWEPTKPRKRNEYKTIYHKTTVITKVTDWYDYEVIYESEVKYDEAIIKKEYDKAKKALELRKEREEFLKELK